MGVLLPIKGLVTVVTITGFIYDLKYLDNKIVDYAMIAGDAEECVNLIDDSGDYTDFSHEDDAVKNTTTLNVRHINEMVILQAIHLVKFDKPQGYLNLTDERVKEMIRNGYIDINKAEITVPEAVADVMETGRNDTGNVEAPSTVLIIKEEEKCLIVFKDEEYDTYEDVSYSV